MEVAGGLLDQKDAYGRTNERIANMACWQAGHADRYSLLSQARAFRIRLRNMSMKKQKTRTGLKRLQHGPLRKLFVTTTQTSILN
jgi:hypothetical protein